jgi:hypothetical protein
MAYRVARCPAQFMEYIARHHVMNDAPPVFIAYLNVLAALAAGPQGAQVGFWRLQCYSVHGSSCACGRWLACRHGFAAHSVWRNGMAPYI